MTLLPAGLGTRVQVPLISCSYSSSKAACLHFSASGRDTNIANSSSLSSYICSGSSSCAGESFHHSLGLSLLRRGNLALIPTGLGALGGGSGEGVHTGAAITVDLGCLCWYWVFVHSCCVVWHICSDYFSCFLSRLIRWFVAFVLYCFSLFGLFVVLKSSSPVSFLFSLWHWAQGLYSVALLII